LQMIVDTPWYESNNVIRFDPRHQNL
jgi:hypothetical protein